MIAANAEANQWTLAELSHNFTISEEEVLAALLYYREHRAEIDQQDVEEQRRWDEMYERSGEHKKDDPQ